MDAPKTKQELLQAMTEGRAEWETLISQISDEDLKKPGVEGTWSIKDVLAHICAYEQYMAAMLADMKDENAHATAMLDAYYQTHLTMARADHPEFPEQLQQVRGDLINQVFVASFQYKRPREVRAMESQAYQELYQRVLGYSDEDLEKPFSNAGGTLLQVLPRQCYIHYYQHIPTIRDWVMKKNG